MEIKTAEQFILRELENAHVENQILKEKIQVLEEKLGTPSKRSEMVAEMNAIELRPDPHKITIFEIAGYDSTFVEHAKKDKEVKDLFLSAIENDEDLIKVAEMKPHNRMSYETKYIYPINRTGLYKFFFNGKEYSLTDDSSKGIDAFPINLHLYEERDIELHFTNQRWVTEDHLDINYNKMLKELREQLKKIKERLEEVTYE